MKIHQKTLDKGHNSYENISITTRQRDTTIINIHPKPLDKGTQPL